jgi:protein-tyrosine phosphatase
LPGLSAASGNAIVIDLHCHILPDIDDGPRTWEESLEMARMAVEDGIRIIVATPHLFRKKMVDLKELNHKAVILRKVREFQERLDAGQIPLKILPGCDCPLSLEALELLEADQVLTINDGKRYLLLEMPENSVPPATPDVCFRLQAQGITPIITHPERHAVFLHTPDKLLRFLDLGCLVQMTAGSLTGVFGRRVAKASQAMVKNRYIQLIATDAHSTGRRPPVLSQAVAHLKRLLGEETALAMVTAIPEKIINGAPVF